MPEGGDLFIVDNSVSGWTGLRYLQEWSEHREELRHRHRLLRDRRAARARRQVAAARQDPDPDGRRGDPSHTKAPSRGRASERAESASTRASRRRRTTNPFLDGVPAIVEALTSRPDRVPRLRRRTSSTPRRTSPTPSSRSSARRRWSARSNFTRPGLTAEHRAQHPDPERPRGRAAPGVVRAALEARPRTSPPTILEVDRAPRPRVLARSRSTRRRCRSSSAATS